MDYVLSNAFNNPLANGSDTPSRTLANYIGSKIVTAMENTTTAAKSVTSTFTTVRSDLLPNVNNAAKQAKNTFKNVDEQVLPKINDVSQQAKNTLNNVDEELIPQMMITMKMIQYTLQKLNDFLRFLKIAIILMIAIGINYIYKHSEFILIIITIMVFSLDLLNIWEEQYFQTVDDDDDRLIDGKMIKITEKIQRLNEMWIDAEIQEMDNKERFLNKYGQIMERNNENQSICLRFEDGEIVWIPIKACVAF